MGSEARCSVRVDGVGAEAKALLETEEVIVRGAVRARVRFRDIKRIDIEGDTLVLRTAGQTIEIDVGAREAARWAEKIRNPKSRLDKLGVKTGLVVSIVGTIADDEFEKELDGRGVKLSKGRARAGSDLIFFGATKTRDLERLARLKASLHPAGAIWIVRPKGVADITESQVMEMAKAAGLVDTKVVKFSETLTAEKVVIPVADRS